MNILPTPQHDERRPSSFTRAWRDLGSPQGSILLLAFGASAIFSITLDVIAGRFNLPRSIIYPIIIGVDFIIITTALIKLTIMYRDAERRRKEAYQQRFPRKIIETRPPSPGGLTYEDAGVSIDTKYAGLRDAKEVIRSTYRPEVLYDIGHFGGLFALDKGRYDNPVLVSSTDSVGTKLKVAFMMNKHDTVGFDLVAHCGNDIAVLGAEPLFFLDYIGAGKLDRRVIVELIDGLARGCREIGCALIGGETAELPSFYQDGEYDLVGTIVGAVDRKMIITGDKITHGDSIIGLASMGLHTNGFALARKIMFEICRYESKSFVQELGTTVGEELLKPHKSYVKSILNLIEKFNTSSSFASADFKVKGMAHITGGGLVDNVPRILPENCNALIEKGSWNVPPIFTFLQEKGNIAESEMYRVFNMGIGMVIVVSADCTEPVMDELKNSGETAYIIGKIAEGPKEVIIV